MIHDFSGVYCDEGGEGHAPRDEELAEDEHLVRVAGIRQIGARSGLTLLPVGKVNTEGGVRAEDMGRQGKPTKENCTRADGTEVRNVGEGVPSKKPPRGIGHGVDLGADSAAKADGGYPRVRAILGDGYEDCFRPPDH